MPVIVVEGPDESGKTTLARAIQTTCAEVPGWEDVYINPSPTRNGWASTLQTYLGELADGHNGSLVIQDRTPEISETVYGAMRGNTRGRGYLYEFYRWHHQDIAIIFCRNDEPYLMGRHTDAAERVLQDSDLASMRLLYDHVYHQLHTASVHGNTLGFKVWEYDRSRPHSWVITMWRLRDWLSPLFPDKLDEINRAFSYHPDSAFPAEVV